MNKEALKKIPGLKAAHGAVVQVSNTVRRGYCKNFQFRLRQIACRNGKDNMGMRLKSLKNSQSGRCFIIATGPSLTEEDMQKLRNEKTFGMNALVKWFPKVGWETTYYGIQDLNTYFKLSDEISEIKDSTIFYSLIGQARKKDLDQVVLPDSDNAYEYPLYYGNHLYKPQEWNTKFSSDPSEVVYDGYTIAYSLLQIAIYLGYSEIYLIGTDCNYNQEKKNIIDIGVKNPNAPILGDRMIYAYTVAKEYADKHGIKIFNATRGGMLEVFPRVDLDQII